MRKLAWSLSLLAACGPGDAAISLVFPNSVARQSIRRLRVESFNPGTGSVASTDRDCSYFEPLAAEGRDPAGTPVRGDYSCNQDPCPEDWFAGLELPKVPRSRQILYVLAYPGSGTDARPVPTLQGCSDRFDGSGDKGETSISVPLTFVLPRTARLVKVAGDRQVGRAGETLGVPLTVAIEADAPGEQGGRYPIPGMEVVFSSDTPGFRLLGGPDSSRVTVFTDVEGRASVSVQLPEVAGAGQVLAQAPALALVENVRSEDTFSVSVTELVRLRTTESIDLGTNDRGISMALGHFDNNSSIDLAVLGCAGSAEGCRSGIDATAPFGTTRLTVLKDVGSPAIRASVDANGDWGILPAGVIAGDFMRGGNQEIALLGSRRGDCQARVCRQGQRCPCWGVPYGGACPCEGSEVRIATVEDNNVRQRRRMTMTGSNAVGLSVLRIPGQAFDSIAVVAQGRRNNPQPCSRATSCLPPATAMCADPVDCGCPPGESCCTDDPEVCGCPPGETCSDGSPGQCLAQDQIVDLLTPIQAGADLVNKEGCQEPRILCNRNGFKECTCNDSARGNPCSGTDECSCSVPEKILIGAGRSPARPRGVSAGPLKSQDAWDIVVPSDGGLELLAARTGSFRWQEQPIVNAPIHAILLADIDTAVEGPRVADAVWFARAPCLKAPNFLDQCPVARALPADEEKGCLGVVYNDGRASIFGLRPPEFGGCRRHSLPFAPDGICVGNFNGDEHLDVVLSAGTSDKVFVYSGDGKGGLLDPPAPLELPPGGQGGPLACGDMDADGRDDIAVSNLARGAVYLLRSGP